MDLMEGIGGGGEATTARPKGEGRGGGSGRGTSHPNRLLELLLLYFLKPPCCSSRAFCSNDLRISAGIGGGVGR